MKSNFIASKIAYIVYTYIPIKGYQCDHNSL